MICNIKLINEIKIKESQKKKVCNYLLENEELETDNSSIDQTAESLDRIFAKYRQIPIQSTNYSQFSLNPGIHFTKLLH